MAKAQVRLQGSSLLENVEIETNGTIIKNAKKYSISQLNIENPISGTVYGTLLNYKGTLEALKDQMDQPPYKNPPKGPVLYIKPKNTYSSFGSPIPLPKNVDRLEIGAAIGIVMKKTATKVSETAALNYIEGFTIVNDVSIPHESYYRPAIRQKARDGFCPAGPWIVSPSSISDLNSISTRVYINDQIVQENTTANLVRTIPQLIADVTDFMTLYPGDVLLVGVPENAPLAKEGDQVRIEIDGIGYLENIIVSEESLELEEIK